MINRRDFNKTLAGLVLSSFVSAPARAAAPAGSQAAERAFLNRLSYGATPESLAELQRLGRAGWLERQLALPARDAALDKRLAGSVFWIEYEAGEGETGEKWDAVEEFRPLSLLYAPPDQLVRLTDYDNAMDYSERTRPMVEVIVASIIRAVHAPAQLREVMTQFWHNHFNVYADKDETVAALFPPYDRALRENALGNFRTLLGQVAHAPAMLHYLNNDNSKASPANENYARELLELHTLGRENYFNDRYDNWHQVPGANEGMATGYIDADVYEVARALTGWTIGDGREYGDNQQTPMSGEFAYVEAWHDPYQKRILGREFPAFSGPMEDGETLLDMLAAHPGTAHFVSGKILRTLGIEAPSKAYHQAIARRFHETRDAPDQIAQVIRAIVAHPEFDATPPTKLRRPFEFVAAIYRATGVDVAPQHDDLFWALENAGWTQHLVHPPTGHSDKTEDWANTRLVNGLVNLGMGAHSDWLDATRQRLDGAPDGARDLAGLLRHWEDRFLVPHGGFGDVLARLDASPDDPLPDNPEELSQLNAVLVTAAALGPEFLFR